MQAWKANGGAKAHYWTATQEKENPPCNSEDEEEYLSFDEENDETDRYWREFIRRWQLDDVGGLLAICFRWLTLESYFLNCYRD